MAGEPIRLQHATCLHCKITNAKMTVKGYNTIASFKHLLVLFTKPNFKNDSTFQSKESSVTAAVKNNFFFKYS